MTRNYKWTRRVLFTYLIVFMALLMFKVGQANATVPWNSTMATWYGPGYYGNHTACGQLYTTRIRGIAHPTMKCGSKLTIKRGSRVVRVTVIDSCQCVFDLSARTAMDLCGCTKPYTMRVKWKHGWLYGQAVR